MLVPPPRGGGGVMRMKDKALQRDAEKKHPSAEERVQRVSYWLLNPTLLFFMSAPGG